MKPSRENQVTLTGLLERVLDKGIILDADLLISIGGVPLIGVNLRAAIAGMETMLKYGLMKQWDEEVRRAESVKLTARRQGEI
ncbi:MAG: gas vesicle protein [Bacillota bacterium]